MAVIFAGMWVDGVVEVMKLKNRIKIQEKSKKARIKFVVFAL